jgi:prepilin-type N-terminal cleavage/methylation domain-containing protein
VALLRVGIPGDRQYRTSGRACRRGLRSGYTLIEIAMVVILIGILTALMVQHITEVKRHAYVASLQSDLRNLETAEESYFVDYDTYTASLPVNRYMPSVDNTYSILSASVTGWSAQVTRTATVGLGTNTCHIAVGTAETTATEWPGSPYCP